MASKHAFASSKLLLLIKLIEVEVRLGTQLWEQNYSMSKLASLHLQDKMIHRMSLLQVIGLSSKGIDNWGHVSIAAISHICLH